MKHRFVRLALAAVLCLCCSQAAFAAVRALGSDVTLVPLAKPGAYQATVEVRDLVSNEVLAAPKIAFMKGEPAIATAKLDSGEEFRFTIQVDASGKSASYSAELRDAGKVVAQQKASIALTQ